MENSMTEIGRMNNLMATAHLVPRPFLSLGFSTDINLSADLIAPKIGF